MNTDFFPDHIDGKLREVIYTFIFKGEILFFSRLHPYEMNPAEKPARKKARKPAKKKARKPAKKRAKKDLINEREGRSPLNITAVSRQVREDSIPFLAGLVPFHFDSRAVAQWFRDTFPTDFRKAVQHVIVYDFASIHFSYPTARIAWPGLKTVTIVERKHQKLNAIKLKTFENEETAAAWIRMNWDLVTTSDPWGPGEPKTRYESFNAIRYIRDIPRRNRTFDLLCAIHINSHFDGVINLDKEGWPVEFMSPPFPTMRRNLMWSET